MAQTPEGKVKDKAKDLYKKHGALYDRTAMNGMGQNGRPDDLVCRNDGHFGAVEFKANKLFKVSALQRVWLNKVKDRGGSSLVVNLTNLELLEQWLTQVGWRVNAEFNDKEVCTGHVATCPGHSPVALKNPGG